MGYSEASTCPIATSSKSRCYSPAWSPCHNKTPTRRQLRSQRPRPANRRLDGIALSPMQLIDPDASPNPNSTAGHDPYAAIRVGNFRLYWIGNLIATLGLQMQAAAL